MSRPQATNQIESGAMFDDLTTPKPDRLPSESIGERCLKSAGDCNTGSLQSLTVHLVGISASKPLYTEQELN